MANSPRFAQTDVDRILQSTFVAAVEVHPEIRSTNDRAMQIARRPEGRLPALVVAERQTRGRGRGANQWWSSSGALTFSLVLETGDLRLPPRSWPRASLTTGLAICEALEDLLDAHPVGLKWPNDVYLGRHKVCGVLIEVPPEPPGRMVVGIGINVNNSVKHAPAELQTTATAMCDAVGKSLSLIDVLERVLLRLDRRWRAVAQDDPELGDSWRRRCLLTNRPVQVDQGMRMIAGLCRGIDEQGALIIETDAGVERCFAGVVTSF